MTYINVVSKLNLKKHSDFGRFSRCFGHFSIVFAPKSALFEGASEMENDYSPSSKRVLGSSSSRSASPRKLKPKTAPATAIAGNSTRCGESNR